MAKKESPTKNFIFEIWGKYKFIIISTLFSAICYVAALIIKDTKVYKEFRGVVDFGYDAKNIIIPRSDSTHQWQSDAIMDMWNEIDYIYDKLDSTKGTNRAIHNVGLVYDEDKKQLFFRTINGDLRTVRHDAELNQYFYRDDNDKKRIINY